MNSNDEVINYKVVYIFQYYNFGLYHFSFQGHLKNSKKKNIKIINLET